MSNFTSSNRVPALHGGQPYTSSHTEGTVPQSPRAGSGEGLPGSPYSRRPKSPEHLPPATIRRIKASQVLAGVREPGVAQSTHEEPPPVTSAGSRAEPGWREWIGSWFSTPQPPEAAEVPGRDAAPQSTRAGILTITVNTPPDLPENSAKNEKAWVEVLKRFFDPENVHVVSVPRDTSWPFVRNLATTTPEGALVTSEITRWDKLDKNMHKTRDAIEEHFHKLGLPVQRLRRETNFANLEYVRWRDGSALIGAESDNEFSLDIPELRQVFDPEHVLVVELDLSKTHGDNPRCYDLDLAFLVTMNAKGEPVALLHSDCLRNDRELRKDLLTADAFRKELGKLGFHVIEVSKAEQVAALGTQAVSNPDAPGKLLFTRDDIPQTLVKKLADADVEAVLPNSKRVLGHNGNEYPIFGLHCLTMNMRIPVAEEEPKEDL